MSKPNFRIIEGAYDDFDYEEFKEDYMNLFISKAEICEKYDLSHNRYCKYGNQVFEDTGFKRSAGVSPRTRYTNIRQTGNNKWRIDKQIGKRKLYCGTYPTFEEAHKVREFLREHNWSNDAIDYCMKGRLK